MFVFLLELVCICILGWQHRIHAGIRHQMHPALMLTTTSASSTSNFIYTFIDICMCILYIQLNPSRTSSISPTLNFMYIVHLYMTTRKWYAKLIIVVIVPVLKLFSVRQIWPCVLVLLYSVHEVPPHPKKKKSSTKMLSGTRF